MVTKKQPSILLSVHNYNGRCNA